VSSRQFVRKKGQRGLGRGCPFPLASDAMPAARISLLTQNRKTEPRIKLRGNLSISGAVEIYLNSTPNTRVLHSGEQLGAPADVKAIQRVRPDRRCRNHQTECFLVPLDWLAVALRGRTGPFAERKSGSADQAEGAAKISCKQLAWLILP
jgi:hypothetical protein